MRVRVVAFALALVLAVPSMASAAEAKKKSGVDCTGAVGFFACAIGSNFAVSCATPWGDCNKHLRKRACEVARDAAMRAWREARAQGIQGPPPPNATKNC